MPVLAMSSELMVCTGDGESRFVLTMREPVTTTSSMGFFCGILILLLRECRRVGEQCCSPTHQKREADCPADFRITSHC